MTTGEPLRVGSTPWLTRIAVLLALSIGISVAERALPVPVPFLRLGLANTVVIYAIMTMGLTDALVLVVLRVLIVSMTVGGFPGPTFMLALGGGLASALAMGAARLASPPLGIVGVSLVGALFHNLGQLAVVAALFVGPGPAARLAPLGALMAAATGLITGITALLVMMRLDRLGTPLAADGLKEGA